MGCAAPGRPDDARALEQSRGLASEPARSHLGAAGSVQEGLEETLTLTRLGVTGSLQRVLEPANPYESMIEMAGAMSTTVARCTFFVSAFRFLI